MRTYHVGLVKRGLRLVVQMRENIDLLDCQTWKYMGQRETTKASIRAKRAELLAAVNAQHSTTFDRITVE